MMKGSARSACKHIDPDTGEEYFVFSCFNQDQELDRVDFENLNARLRQNSVQEKLSNRWLDLLLERDRLGRARDSSVPAPLRSTIPRAGDTACSTGRRCSQSDGPTADSRAKLRHRRSCCVGTRGRRSLRSECARNTDSQSGKRHRYLPRKLAKRYSAEATVLMRGETRVPSDRSFGYTFAVAFALLTAWLVWQGSRAYLVALLIALAFAATTAVNARLLRPLNLLWMRLGMVLNSVVSPVVLGAIFVLLFVPIGLWFRITKRRRASPYLGTGAHNLLLGRESSSRTGKRQLSAPILME